MKKNIILFAVVAMLAGCASVVPTPAPKDQEPVLTGLSMKERVATASKDINNQVELLNKINENRYVGKYKMVTHNNELDARKGSSRTVPPEQKEVTVVQAKAPEAVKTGDTIKKIDWKHSSLNDLVKGFASAAGYKLVLVSNSADRNVTFSVENENIFSALNRLKTQVMPFALITVVDKEKTIYLNYN
jgi:hypothetical protein